MEKHPESPPKLGEKILKRFVPAGVKGRSIIGDLREEYLEHLHSGSRITAALHYWKIVVSIALRFRWHSKRSEGKSSTRDGGRRAYLDNLLYDVKLAVRMLAKKPGLTITAVITLGLGIGANTTIFSIVNTVLLQPLPYEEPERLVGVFRIDPDLTGENPTPARIASLFAVPLPVYRDWRDLSPVFANSGAFGPNAFTLTGGDGPERVIGAFIDSGVFDTLGVKPMLGRDFLPEEDQVGAPPLAVLSHGLWQRRFGADPDILGQKILLSGTIRTIVGVMPPGFSYPGDNKDVWANFTDQHIESAIRNGGWLQVIARLRSGVSHEQAQLEMDGVARRICEQHPEECEHGIGLFPEKELEVADTRSGLLLLLGAVGLVLLIACANMANLLLVRASERRKETGLRQALGAGRSRLLIQHLSESVMLSLVGGVVGCIIAVAGLRPLAASFPEGLPRATEITVDFRLLLFAAGLSLLTGLVIGVLPALRAIKTPVAETLRDGGRGFAGGRHRNRTQAVLVVSEIALAFVLLAGAALFIKSFSSLSAVEPGFVVDNMLTMSIEIPGADRDPDAAADAAGAFFSELDEKLLSLPGVQAVGRANQMPFVSGLSFPPTSIDSSEGIVEDNVHNSTVTPEYFTTLEIPLVAGRGFTSTDRKGTQLVALVCETMARKHWPEDDPIGRRVRVDVGDDPEWITVVGVVGDVKHRLNWAPFDEFYIPYAQWPTEYQNVVIKTAIDPMVLAPSVREAVWAIDPNLPVSIRALDEQITRSKAVVGHRFRIFMLGCLSGLAALLAVVGVYGVLAYTVSQRSNEIGIRLALGAGKTRVVRSVLSRGLAMAGIGLALGWAIASAASRVMESLLFQVSPTDPMTLAGVALLVAVAATAASTIPALCATRVDPVEALKGE